MTVKIYRYRGSMHADYYARGLRRNVVNQVCVVRQNPKVKEKKIKKWIFCWPSARPDRPDRSGAVFKTQLLQHKTRTLNTQHLTHCSTPLILIKIQGLRKPVTKYGRYGNGWGTRGREGELVRVVIVLRVSALIHTSIRPNVQSMISETHSGWNNEN